MGYVTGFNTGFKLTEKLSMCLGLQQSNLGTTVKNNISGLVLIDSKYKLNYLQLPVYLRYTLISKKISPFFTIGVTTSYLTALSVGTHITIISPSSVDEMTSGVVASGKDWKGFSRVELSVTGSAGFAINLNTGKLLLEAKYQHGFTDIERYAGAIINRTILYSIGYLFPLNLQNKNTLSK